MKRITLTFSDSEYEAVRKLAETRFPGIAISLAVKSALLLAAADREPQRTSAADREPQRTSAADRERQQHTQDNARARGSSSGSGKKKEKEKKGIRAAPIEIAKRIVDDLNQRAGTSFRATGKRVRQLIALRLADGYTEADFRSVHRKKSYEWKGSDMEKYLRPETLYGTKFEQYVGQLETKPDDPPEAPKRGLYVAGEGWMHYEGDQLVPGPYPS